MIEKKDIEKLANLSRIKLTEEEKDSFQKEIDGILVYVAQIQKVSSGAAELQGSEVAQTQNVFRDDVILNKGGDFTEDLLKLAPDREDNFVKVKNIF